MRLSLWILLAAIGCSGGAEPEPVGELCANGSDDDGDGKVDCADTDCATECGLTPTTGTPGGAPTGGTPGGALPTNTGITNPSSPLSILIDPTVYQWQHEVGLSACPQPLGRILFDNPTDEQAQIVVWSERYQGADVFSFNLENETQIEFWVDWPIAPQSTGTVWVYYACTAPGSFGHVINVDFSTSSESNGATIVTNGTIL